MHQAGSSTTTLRSLRAVLLLLPGVWFTVSTGCGRKTTWPDEKEAKTICSQQSRLDAVDKLLQTLAGDSAEAAKRGAHNSMLRHKSVLFCLNSHQVLQNLRELRNALLTADTSSGQQSVELSATYEQVMASGQTLVSGFSRLLPSAVPDPPPPQNPNGNSIPGGAAASGSSHDSLEQAQPAAGSSSPGNQPDNSGMMPVIESVMLHNRHEKRPLKLKKGNSYPARTIGQLELTLYATPGPVPGNRADTVYISYRFRAHKSIAAAAEINPQLVVLRNTPVSYSRTVVMRPNERRTLSVDLSKWKLPAGEHILTLYTLGSQNPPGYVFYTY